MLNQILSTSNSKLSIANIDIQNKIYTIRNTQVMLDKHWDLWLEIKIIFKTIMVVVGKKGI